VGECTSAVYFEELDLSIFTHTLHHTQSILGTWCAAGAAGCFERKRDLVIDPISASNYFITDSAVLGYSGSNRRTDCTEGHKAVKAQQFEFRLSTLNLSPIPYKKNPYLSTLALILK
jgi:hypothetical protein